MTKNNGKGGNKRRKGKRAGEDARVHETIFKEDCMGYGYIEKTYGNGRFHVMCEDGQTRMGILRGSLRRKVWITGGDLVLYGIREFQDNKIDIVHKYTNDDVSKLYRYDEISKQIYDMYISDIHCRSNADAEEGIMFAHEDDQDQGEEPELDEWTKVSSTADIQSLIDAI